MAEHPCSDGLSASCFRAYPKWARQAFAYKLLHIMLPKQLSKNLPRGLGLALVPPGVILPPGVVLPPGTIVPPGVTFPPGWTPGDPAPPGVVIPPGTTFPPGWTPGDPAPPGVVIPPGTTFPPGWTPGDPAPPGVQLPPVVSPIPPYSGAVPPLYVQPWEPGPIKPPGYLISGETPLIVQGPGDAGREFGNDDLTYKLYGLIPNSISAIITKVSITIGTMGSPVDQLILEIRESSGPTEPGNIITNGESTPIPAYDLPPFDTINPNLTPISIFYFPNSPQLNSGTTYFLGMTRSAPSNASDYYQVLKSDDPTGKLQYKTYLDDMGNSFLEDLDFKIYGSLI